MAWLLKNKNEKKKLKIWASRGVYTCSSLETMSKGVWWPWETMTEVSGCCRNCRQLKHISNGYCRQTADGYCRKSWYNIKYVPTKSVLSTGVSAEVLRVSLFPLISNAVAYVLTLLSSNISGVTQVYSIWYLHTFSQIWMLFYIVYLPLNQHIYLYNPIWASFIQALHVESPRTLYFLPPPVDLCSD